MFSNVHSSLGTPYPYPANTVHTSPVDTVDTNERKRPPANSSALNDVQPLNSSERLKGQPVNNSPRDMRRDKSELCATDIQLLYDIFTGHGGRESNSAGIAQYNWLENLQELENTQVYEPDPILETPYFYAHDHDTFANAHAYASYHATHVNYHHYDANYHSNAKFVGRSLEGNNDQKPAATLNLHQTSGEFEPIPYSDAYDAASRD